MQEPSQGNIPIIASHYFSCTVGRLRSSRTVPLERYNVPLEMAVVTCCEKKKWLGSTNERTFPVGLERPDNRLDAQRKVASGP